MADRLDPLEEALRLWALLTAAERVRFLAHVTTGIDPATGGSPQHDDDRDPRVVLLGGEGEG